jgi:GH15 family glucan-1,4-alpha-glucosidase
VYGYKKISDYGVIGDMHSAALVGVDGSVDWCCFPRFDSPSVFAALLDAKKGGMFQLAPAEEGYRVSQQYEKDTNVLSTVFRTSRGSVKLTDFMPYFIHHGEMKVFHEIVRIVERGDGSMKKMRLIFQPRLNFANGETRLDQIHGGVRARNGRRVLSMISNVPYRLTSSQLVTEEFELPAHGSAFFVVRYGKGPAAREAVYEPGEKLARTIGFWREWVRHIQFGGRWRDQVVRSALVLKLLQYVPTGAMVAAVTTSLPETIGGERNWDYRYSWVRDAAFSSWALDSIGATREAVDYARCVLNTRRRRKQELGVMMNIAETSDMMEVTLDHLEGYMRSRPVRIGNAAHDQLQLGVYGALIDSIYFLHKVLGWTTKPMYEFLVRDAANFVSKNWKKPDSGIWEMRTRPKFFVESKVWCYVALDRAVRLAEAMGFDEDIAYWKPIMQQIKEEVIARGWSERKQAFTQEYGGDALDAANLLIPLVHFLPAKDPRVSSSIERIREELSEGDLIYRYKTADGLRGKEGAFTVCSFWMVDCLVRLGRLKEARTWLERLLRRANHLGLYSEEIDPKTGDMLGNFPQAYAHMGLISAVLHVDRAMGHARDE